MVLPRRRFLVRGPSIGNAVALTFDDGPHPEITPRLLDLLSEHQLKATFFVVGRVAEQHPGLLARMVREGHDLGHHSWTHSEPASTTTATLLSEIDQTNALIWEQAGVVPMIVRPPKGQLTTGKLLSLIAHGERVVLWSVDPKDYAMTSAGPLVRWAREVNLIAGDVVLLHDAHPHCLEAIPVLAARLGALGLGSLPLRAWLPTDRARR